MFKRSAAVFVPDPYPDQKSRNFRMQSDKNLQHGKEDEEFFLDLKSNKKEKKITFLLKKWIFGSEDRRYPNFIKIIRVFLLKVFVHEFSGNKELRRKKEEAGKRFGLV